MAAEGTEQPQPARQKQHLPYLHLSNPPVATFEPDDSTINRVFFDQSTGQVLAARSQGTTGVTVLGPSPALCHKFRIATDRGGGTIRSIKFSPNQSILSMRRGHSSLVEFFFFKSPEIGDADFSQPCKAKSGKIQEFHWIGDSNIVFVTNISLEYYSVNANKKQVKLLKSVSMNVAWSMFHVVSSPKEEFTGLLVLATYDQLNSIQPVLFRPSGMTRLARFEVDMPMSSTRAGQKQVLRENAVSVLQLHGETYVGVVRKQLLIPNRQGSELVLYHVLRDAPAKKSFILRLSAEPGSFAINVVDNLVIVHHQEQRTSLLFDTRLPGDSDGFAVHLAPVVPPMPIDQPLPLFNPDHNSSQEVVLYDKAWVVFRPDVIINPLLGAMWRLRLTLPNVVPMFTSNPTLLRFLQHRAASRPLQLLLFERFFTQRTLSLEEVATLFDISNATYKHFLETKNNAASCCSEDSVITQTDMCSIFQDLRDKSECHARSKYMVAVVLEFIKSLGKNHFVVNFAIEESLVNQLVTIGQFYQLHQFLQYHVISDSKPMACALLSLQRRYSPAHQLSLDMMKRLGTAHNEIIEVLLSSGDVIGAIKYARQQNMTDELKCARKFLDVAMKGGDRKLFYTTYKFFQATNLSKTGSTAFSPFERCEKYTAHFKTLFGDDSYVDHTLSQATITQELSVF